MSNSDQELQNPYLDEVRDYLLFGDRLSRNNMEREFEIMSGTIERGKSVHQIRFDYVEKYAWAVPTREAIETLVAHDPLIEIGAGTGYWAWLVEQLGGDIVAVDAFTRDYYDEMDEDDFWTAVREGDEQLVADYPDHTPFLCWPELGGSFATEALELTESDTVIYVGEGKGGATGNDEFHRRLESDYELEELIQLPKWPGLHDDFYLYKR